jgi:hypothetical protein
MINMTTYAALLILDDVVRTAHKKELLRFIDNPRFSFGAMQRMAHDLSEKQAEQPHTHFSGKQKQRRQ